jgi:hypothetical protein
MQMIDLALTKKEKTERMSPKAFGMQGPDYPYGLTLRLDKEQIKKLGLSYDVGDECQIVAIAKVTSKSKHEHKDGDGSESIELQLTKMGVGAVESEESMKDYAKRRNAELREG